MINLTVGQQIAFRKDYKVEFDGSTSYFYRNSFPTNTSTFSLYLVATPTVDNFRQVLFSVGNEGSSILFEIGISSSNKIFFYNGTTETEFGDALITDTLYYIVAIYSNELVSLYVNNRLYLTGLGLGYEGVDINVGKSILDGYFYEGGLSNISLFTKEHSLGVIKLVTDYSFSVFPPTVSISAPTASSSWSAETDVSITISGTCTDATSVEIWADIDGAGYISWGSDLSVEGNVFSVERTISEGDAGSVVLKATATGPGGVVDSSTVSITVTDDLGDVELATWTGLQVWLDPKNVASLTMGAAPTINDGDMEAVGTADWTPLKSIVLTKEGNAYEGSQCLRAAYGGESYPKASIPLIVGNRYVHTGVARSDGANVFRLNDGAYIWDSTTSTSWQAFDVESTSTSLLYIFAWTTGAGYVELDNFAAENLSLTSITPRAGALASAFSQATATAQPWIDSTTGAMRFAGTADVLTYAGSAADYTFLTTGNMTLFLAAKFSDASAYAPLLSSYGTDGIILRRDNSTSNLQAYFANDSGGNNYSTSGGISTGDMQVFEAVINGANSYVVIDGTQVGTAGYTQDAGAGVIALSLGKKDAYYLNGEIGDTIAFNRALTATERTRLRNYLAAKWSITLP